MADDADDGDDGHPSEAYRAGNDYDEDGRVPIPLISHLALSLAVVLVLRGAVISGPEQKGTET